MTADTPGQQRDADSPPPKTGPETGPETGRAQSPAPSSYERVFVRISIMQTVIAAAGIFTGAVALYAALSQADSARKAQQAMVWPELLVGSSFNPTAQVATAEFSGYGIVAENAGIGPARMRAVRVRVDGQTHTGWNGVLTALLDQPTPHTFDYVNQRTILAGQRVALLVVRDEDASARLRQEINNEGRLQIEACYCSVFDDCWTVGFFTRSEPVKACPDYGDEQFLD